MKHADQTALTAPKSASHPRRIRRFCCTWTRLHRASQLCDVLPPNRSSSNVSLGGVRHALGQREVTFSVRLPLHKRRAKSFESMLLFFSAESVKNPRLPRFESFIAQTSTMKSLLILALVTASSVFSVDSAATKGDRLRLKIIKHQPCTRKSTVSEKIRFPTLAQAPLANDTRRGNGCYVINGPTTISKPISGTVQVYTELKLSTKGAVEQCQNADNSGCGGAGSCVYCDTCTTGGTIEKTSSGLVQVSSTDGKPFDCHSGVRPGTYGNIRISFCMPTKEEVLKSQNIDEDFWQKNAAQGRMFLVTMYVFDEKVNGLSSAEMLKKANTDNPHVIGCHKIVGSIYEGDNRGME